MKMTVTWDESEVQLVRYSETLDIPDDLLAEFDSEKDPLTREAMRSEFILDYTREHATYSDKDVRYGETEESSLIDYEVIEK